MDDGIKIEKQVCARAQGRLHDSRVFLHNLTEIIRYAHDDICLVPLQTCDFKCNLSLNLFNFSSAYKISNMKLRNMKLNLTKPAWIATVAYLIMGLMILLPINNTYLDDENGKVYQAGLGYRFFVLLIMLIPIGLSIYSLNCMMVGHCTTWSYIQAIAICVWVVLFVVATLLSGKSSKESSKN